MGSGTNRAWWREKGSRSGRRAGSKADGRRGRPRGRFVKAKAWRAEAARRSNEGTNDE